MTKIKINIKSAIFVLALLLNGAIISAQEAPCKAKFVTFQELAKEADFNEIYTSWLDLRKTCGTSDETIFIVTEKILAQKVEEASASDEKNQMIQKLVSIYDDHDKVFPNNKNGNRVSKAILLYENKQSSSREIYSFLEQAFKIDNASFIDANVLNVYADLIIAEYNSPEKKLSIDQVLEKLDNVFERAQAVSKKHEMTIENFTQKSQTEKLTATEANELKTAQTNLRDLGLVIRNLNGNVDKITNCETLTAFYQKAFDKNAENGLWLERASERLNARNCKTDLYLKISEKWNQVSPTAKSAYNLAMIARQNRDQEKTIEYFTQSAALQKDASKKADLFYLIASAYGNRNKPMAKEFVKKALEAKPSSGKSYIFLAQLYASSSNDCGKDNFEKKAIYWLAANTAKQAGIVEPALKKSADQAASDFTKKAPSKAEVSQAKRKAGEQISYDCWIGETVSIPKL